MKIIFLAAALAFGALGPQPPCEGQSPFPAFAAAGKTPNYHVWTDVYWAPPACTGWIPKLGVVVAVAGRFNFDGTVDDLALRFGAISTLKDVRYWSVTEHTWLKLIPHAAALRSPALEESRPDFTATEMTSGRDLYFTETDNRLNEPVLYRMRAKTKDQSIVVTITNVSPVEKFMLTLAQPGDLESIHYLARIAPSTWSYYALARTATTPLHRFGVTKTESFVNRALALYSHFTNTVIQPLRAIQ